MNVAKRDARQPFDADVNIPLGFMAPGGLEVPAARRAAAHEHGVEIVRDSRGTLQDKALNERGVLLRLQVQMRKRLISVTTVSEDDCEQCQKVLGLR